MPKHLKCDICEKYILEQDLLDCMVCRSEYCKDCTHICNKISDKNIMDKQTPPKRKEIFIGNKRIDIHGPPDQEIPKDLLAQIYLQYGKGALDKTEKPKRLKSYKNEK